MSNDKQTCFLITTSPDGIYVREYDKAKLAEEISDGEWEGYEFLDKIRNDTVWGKIRAKIQEKGGSIPFDVMSALALKYAKQLVGLDDS